MKNKWYLSAFVIALAILGISLEQSAVPNQEIIIQFSDTKTSIDQTQEAIALVKDQLETVHVDNIKIEQLVNGSLKVTYYSDIEVSDIKKMFSDALGNSLQHLDNGDSDTPFENQLEYYHLDIYKIQDSSDLDGAVGDVLESKSETTRSTSFKSYASINKLSAREQNRTEHIAYNSQKNNTIAIDNFSFNIPEVRAGPKT